MPWIGFAAELTALMRLVPLYVFSPKRLAFPSDMKFWVAPVSTRALCPLLSHCVGIDSVLSGKKLIQALPRLTIRLLVNWVWVHLTCCLSFILNKP